MGIHQRQEGRQKAGHQWAGSQDQWGDSQPLLVPGIQCLLLVGTHRQEGDTLRQEGGTLHQEGGTLRQEGGMLHQQGGSQKAASGREVTSQTPEVLH